MRAPRLRVIVGCLARGEVEHLPVALDPVTIPTASVDPVADALTMTRPKKPAGGTSAAELMAKLHDDPGYQRKTRLAEAERIERVQALRRAEETIVADLRATGMTVDSVWDLVNTADPYPEALPILLEHLERGGYPDRVMESLGRALAVGPAAPAWGTLRERYLRAAGRGEEEGLAVALAVSATADHLDSLIALLDEKSRGASRVHFLRPIKRVGGDRGIAVLNSLRHDPLYGKEARALLKRQ